MKRLLVSGCILLLSATANHVAIAQAPDLKPILVGHSYPQTGHLAMMASQMKAGLDAALAEANAAGGVNGRKIQVISMDDAFQEEKFEHNVRRLVTDEKVVAIVCPVGTNQVQNLNGYAREAGVPIIGARVGSDFVRKYNRYVYFNHASFNDEIEFLTRQLATVGVKRVSVAYMDLPFGKDLIEVFKIAAAKHQVSIDRASSFSVSGEDAASLAQQLAATPSLGYIVLGSGSSAANFAKNMIASGVKPNMIYGLSVMPLQELVQQLGSKSNGIILSQVMPSPVSFKLPLVKQYQEALAKFGGSSAAPSQFGLEAYISGRLLVEGLRRAKGPLTREGLTASLDSLGTINLGGLSITYNSQSHHGLRLVELAIISNGQLVY